MKVSKAQSDTYMEGWMFRHRHGPVSAPNHMVLDEWTKGFSDCCQGKIDARWALGPDFLESNHQPKTP